MTDPPPETPDLVGEWDDATGELSVRDRVYDVAIQLYDPTRVADVAERADCAKETARDYLRWLADAGIVLRVDEDPERFERNDSYFEWKRVFELQQRSAADLRAELRELSERESSFRERFDADAPDAVDAVEHADYENVEAVWDALDEWRAIRERIDLLDRARREHGGSNATV